MNLYFNILIKMFADLLHILSYMPKELNFVNHTSYLDWREYDLIYSRFIFVFLLYFFNYFSCQPLTMMLFFLVNEG